MPGKRWSAAIAVLGSTVLLGGCFFGIMPPAPPAPKPPVLDAACKSTLVATTPGTVAANALVELSGLAASRRTDGVWWAHNDSGDSARVFALGDDGRDLGAYTLAGASAIDWEDLAAGPGPSGGVAYLYAADIGDNAHARSSVRVYRVAEPAVDPSAPTPAPQTLTGVDTLTFTYPSGPYDAESFFVDPASGELYILTKDVSGLTKVFRAPANLAAGSTTMLTQVASMSLGVGLGGLVTAADITPAANVIALRTYSRVLLYPRLSGTTVGSSFARTGCTGKPVTESQGEAIAFTRDGRGYTTASEGLHPALHRFTAP